MARSNEGHWPCRKRVSTRVRSRRRDADPILELLLLDNGADITAKDTLGFTRFHFARWGHKSQVQRLLGRNLYLH